MSPSTLRSIVVLCPLLVVMVAGRPLDASESSKKQRVTLRVVGTLEVSGATARIVAKAKRPALDVPLDIDFRGPSKDAYRAAAARLDGKTVEIRGELVSEKEDDKNRRRKSEPKLVLVPAREPAEPKKNRSEHYVTVVCQGVVHTGIVAVGGETTGIEIEVAPDDAIRWQLDADGRNAEKVSAADGRRVTVAGTLSVKRGVSGPDRWIVDVRSVREK